MTPAMKDRVSRQTTKVAKELTEYVNHAWGLLFSYLAESGDAVVAEAQLPLATHASVNGVMLLHGLDQFHTANAGVYMVNPLFTALLSLGYDVYTGAERNS